MTILKSSFRFCFVVIVMNFVKIVYGSANSDFNVISTTEKPTTPQTNQKDVAKLCFDFIEIKLKEIVQQNFEIVRNENKKQIQEIKSEMFHKLEKLQKTKSEIFSKIEEIEKKIDTMIENKENMFKTQQQEDILKNEKLLKEIETNILSKIEKNQKHLQQIEEKKNICIKEQAEIIRISTSLEIKNQKIEDTLVKVLDNVKKNTVPENCQDLLQLNYTSTGVYTIQPKKSSKRFEVLCNMNTRGGGWTYLMKRFDGSQNFYLKWEDYKNGFGSLSREFWLGLQHVYEMTSGYLSFELLIELVDWDNVTKYALYDNFKLGDETEGYKIKQLESYKGDAGDSLYTHKNLPFVTKDRDNYHTCATRHKGAWWYDHCWKSHLTGLYHNREEARYTAEQGMSWFAVTGWNRGLKEARILIRPKDTSTKKS